MCVMCMYDVYVSLLIVYVCLCVHSVYMYVCNVGLVVYVYLCLWHVCVSKVYMRVYDVCALVCICVGHSSKLLNVSDLKRNQ